MFGPGVGRAQGRIQSPPLCPHHPPSSCETTCRDRHVTQARGPLQDPVHSWDEDGDSFQAERLGKWGLNSAIGCVLLVGESWTQKTGEEAGMRDRVRRWLLAASKLCNPNSGIFTSRMFTRYVRFEQSCQKAFTKCLFNFSFNHLPFITCHTKC